MKKYLALLAIGIMSVGFTGCGHKRVELGSVGVKVNLYGSNKGETKVVGSGGYWLGFGQDIYEYPTTQTQYSYTKVQTEESPDDEAFNFNVKGGVACSVDLGVIAYVDSSKADLTYTTYRADMQTIMKKFVKQEIRNVLNTEANKLSIDEVTDGKFNEVLKTVETQVKEKMAKVGIVIVNISAINKVEYPKQIQEAIVAKIKATQTAMQKENELRSAEADAKITEARANAEAIANESKKVSINKELIEYEKVQNEKLMIEKWDGKMPQTVTIAGSDSRMNLILGAK